jgi:hypothetical protein
MIIRLENMGRIMFETFDNKLHLNKANRERLSQINAIIEEYSKQGYRLTLRQLYYQLVSRMIIPNNTKEYAKLSSILVKGRMGGVVDWDAIEDRIRQPFLPYWVIDIADALNDTKQAYRLDRQEGQENYIELWCEKDALSGVLKRVTSHYHINLMVNRGYSSCSAMHDAYKRFVEQNKVLGKEIIILYLGDHDPSGVDMVRDIRQRFEDFGIEVTVIPVALTSEQIKKYNPPPNPAKFSDPRAKDYIEKFGSTSWEVDALKPEILHEIVIKNIVSLIDVDKFNKMIKKEELDKKEIDKFIRKHGR